MRIDPDELHSGANQLYGAAWLAQEAADKLAGGSVGEGIFGSFADAQAFHGVVTSAHRRHTDSLVEHQKRLGVLGDKTHKTASVFVEMEERNARAMREVMCPTIQN